MISYYRIATKEKQDISTSNPCPIDEIHGNRREEKEKEAEKKAAGTGTWKK